AAYLDLSIRQVGPACKRGMRVTCARTSLLAPSLTLSRCAGEGTLCEVCARVRLLIPLRLRRCANGCRYRPRGGVARQLLVAMTPARAPRLQSHVAEYPLRARANLYTGCATRSGHQIDIRPAVVGATSRPQPSERAAS